ncbi:MAG: hypothetical protein M3494_04230 [Actinomycetota bacterium]|nr:hypothetical protein [Rubrobacter sp.]MDQ3507212.1 hypothetical protein [Actinomycetota bacterium]
MMPAIWFRYIERDSGAYDILVRMEHWHGFGPKLSISQVYETTVADADSELSAHFVVIPARSLGGDSYLFRGEVRPLEFLGLRAVADIPLGGVARSLAACLVSGDVEEFMRKFDEGFRAEIEQSSTTPVPHFGFAEYLTFARVIPFEWASLDMESLGHIITASGRGKSGYFHYEDVEAPMMVVAIPAGIVICGSTKSVAGALEAGLRERILKLASLAGSGESGDAR